jgi:hypothetical protein
MTADANVEFVKSFFAAFGRGDIDFVIEAHDSEVVSEAPVSLSSTLPWAGVRHGRGGVVEYFRDILKTVRPEPFEDLVFTASGDRVVVEGRNKGTVLATGETYDHEWVMVFTIRDGKVVRFRDFYDPADIEAAMAH